MISKEELRKHSKDELVNLTYDLFLKCLFQPKSIPVFQSKSIPFI